MPVSKGRLKPEDEYKIKKNYTFMIEELDANEIVPHLFSKGVLTLDDKEEIEETKPRGKRNELLLDMILRSGSGDSYRIFIETLMIDYEHVAKEIESTVIVSIPSSTPYSWFDNVKESIKNHVIQDSDASRIASKLGNEWEILMIRLGINQIDIQRERTKNSSDTLSITHLLIKWRQRVVGQATVQNLILNLKELEDESLLTIDWEGLRKIIENLEKS